GRPMILALNMFDLAQRQGINIDIEGLSRELGIPIVTTVAVRKRGLDALLQEIDRAAPQTSEAGAVMWHEPSASELRVAHSSADRIRKTYVKPPARPDTFTARLDGVLLHPVLGTLILMGVLFLMFQAVFTWATPLQDLIDAGFTAVGGWVKTILPDGLLRSFIT